MPDSPWVGLTREQFRAYVYDQSRINRLRQDPTYFLQSGWAEEVSERRPSKAQEWTPPAKRRNEHNN